MKREAKILLLTFSMTLMIITLVWAASYVWWSGPRTIQDTGEVSGTVTWSGNPIRNSEQTVTVVITSTWQTDRAGTITVQVYDETQATLLATLATAEPITVPPTGWTGAFYWIPIDIGTYFAKATFVEA